MAAIDIKPKSKCKYDLLALGEVMIRFDPGDTRIHTARSFKVWEGGGEYNVSRALKRCFAKDTAVVTAIPDNHIGHLLEDLILQGGVNMEYVKWVPFDGIGRTVRTGIYFAERGFGIREMDACYDRGLSAASQLKKGDIDWGKIFGRDGVRWFHTGGIFAGLSESTPDVIIEAVAIARKYGTIVSYDLNYRQNLWASIGGHKKAVEVNKKLAPFVDVMFGNRDSFNACLGFEIKTKSPDATEYDSQDFRNMINEVIKEFPNFRVIGSTLRKVKIPALNDWGAIVYSDGQFAEANYRKDLWIYDRIGGGDSFASGLIYGLLEGKSPKQAVDYGAAHAALVMTTPGDNSMATLKEVEKLIASDSK